MFEDLGYRIRSFIGMVAAGILFLGLVIGFIALMIIFPIFGIIIVLIGIIFWGVTAKSANEKTERTEPYTINEIDAFLEYDKKHHNLNNETKKQLFEAKTELEITKNVNEGNYTVDDILYLLSLENLSNEDRKFLLDYLDFLNNRSYYDNFEDYLMKNDDE